VKNKRYTSVMLCASKVQNGVVATVCLVSAIDACFTDLVYYRCSYLTVLNMKFAFAASESFDRSTASAVGYVTI